MVTFIREKFIKGKSKVQESTSMKMEMNSKENGRMIRNKEKGLIGQQIRKG